MLYSAGCSSTRLINFSRYPSSITSLYINHHKSSTNKRRRLCNLQMGQHVVVPGSHAMILGRGGGVGLPGKIRHGRLLYASRITHDVHVVSLFLFSMISVSTHHASRITRMWSRSFMHHTSRHDNYYATQIDSPGGREPVS